MWTDSLTWVKGIHTVKFGADVRRARFDQTLYYNVSGDFTFNSTTENSVLSTDNYPGYLLGLDDSYTQGSAQRENVRTTGFYLFAQDSWKINPSLTLNYGLRWELDTPLTDVLHHVQTFRPGQNSTVYPCQLTAGRAGQFRSQHLCGCRGRADRPGCSRRHGRSRRTDTDLLQGIRAAHWHCVQP